MNNINKKIRVEDMKVSISFSNKKVDKDRLCDIFIDIIKDLQKEGAKDETKCSTIES